MDIINFGYIFNFQFPFEYLSSIIKDIQTIGELINFFQKKSISNIIILKGEKTFTKNTFFYFKYKQLINLYFKTINYFETDYFLRIEYKLYKSNQKMFEIYFNFNLHYIEENLSQLLFEIKLKNIKLNKLIIDANYKEFLDNCKILSKSIKDDKLFEFINTNILINCNYDLIMNISTHYDLFKLFLPSLKFFSKVKNYNGENEKNNENDEGILKQDLIFNIIIKNIKKYDFISNNFSIKVDKIKLSNDFFFVKFKFLKFGKFIKIPIYSLIYSITKVSKSHSFISLKLNFNYPLYQRFIDGMKKYLNKLLSNLKTICSNYLLKQQKNNRF